MAINKRKVLEAARKYVQKGAKQKALKEYERLVKADPRDGKLRLEIGDAHRRWGQIEEAVTQYTKVADQYKADGFDARAVAVYKQVLNLDPKRYTAHVSLSELYQRMGLDAEAVAALHQAAEGYQKEGQKREALELLRKMAALDPGNTTSRMKVADLLRQEGLEDEAVAEYEGVAEELERQGSHDTLATVYARILEIRPRRVDILVATARTLMQLSQPERAEGFAKQASEIESDETSHLELLCDVYKALDRDDALAEATRKMAQVYRDRGDDQRAREMMQRLPSSALALGADVSEIADPSEAFDVSEDLSADEVLDDNEFLATDDEVELDQPEFDTDGEMDLGVEGEEFPIGEPGSLGSTPAPEPELELEAPVESGTPLPPVEGPAIAEPDELPSGDPEQLIAEASVYLRYGKRDQAVASLKGVIAQEPGHRDAHEKLGEVFADAGDPGRAVEHWTQAAERARDDGDADGFSVLRDRIAALDADAAGALAPMEAEAAAAPEPEPELAPEPEVAPEPAKAKGAGGPSIDLDALMEEAVAAEDDAGDVSEVGEIEIDIDDGQGVDASEDETDEQDVSEDAPVEETATADDASDEGDLGPDVDLDLDLDEDEPEEAPAVAAASPVEDTADEIDIDLDTGDDLSEDEPVEIAAEEPTAPEETAAPVAASSLEDDLEEADFYFQQDMREEAAAIYRRVLEADPEQATARERLVEIEGEDALAPADEPDLEVDDGSAGEDRTESVMLGAPDEDQEAEAGLGAERGALSTPTLEQVDEPVAQSEAPKKSAKQSAKKKPAEKAPEPEAEPIAAAVEDIASPGDDAEAALADVAQSVAAEPDVHDDATFDLAAELREAFDDDEDPNETSGVLSTVEDGFESIFSEFKKGVSEALTEGDTDTRYDLGIAYREMGLYEDAIAEFRVCLGAADRQLEVLTMMGLCALDLGRGLDAVNHFEQALSIEGLEDGSRLGLTFDLARALEAHGDTPRARESYQWVAARQPDFQDVAERLAALCDGDGDAASDAAPESADAGQTESFESFDDLLSEAADDPEPDEEPEPDPEPDPVEPDPEPEPNPAAENGGGGKGRKKKISFA